MLRKVARQAAAAYDAASSGTSTKRSFPDDSVKKRTASQSEEVLVGSAKDKSTMTVKVKENLTFIAIY